MNPDKDYIESLLPRYCDGNVTDEERRMVVEWMNASEENKRIAKQINLIYLASHAIKVRRDIDTDKALNRVKGKMIVHRKRKYWEWAQRAAAVLFIPLLAATLLLSLRPEAESMPEVTARLMEVGTSPGMTGSFVLPDGTKVYLNSETKLTYPNYFDGETREVTLSGEAYFEVAKDAEHRFIVHTPHHSQIEVLGTSFNVEAYENDEEITTTLVEGRVNFYYNNRETQTKQLVSLQPNEQLVYQCDSHEVDLRPTSCLAETAWKDGKIVFRNTTLRDGLKTLAKRYNVEFIIKNPKGLDDPFTGTFTNQRLERILQYFSISSHIRWRYVDGGDINETKSKIEIY